MSAAPDVILHNCTNSRKLSRYIWRLYKTLNSANKIKMEAGKKSTPCFWLSETVCCTSNKPPKEALLKILNLQVLVSHSISSSAVTHTVAAATRGEGSYVIVPNFQKDFFHGEAGQSGYKTTVTLNAENNRKTPGFPPVVQKSIVADLLKTARKHMHHKTADEFDTGNCDHCLFIGFIISGMERNFVLSNRDDSGIGNGNAVGISSEIFNGISISVEGFFDLSILVNGIERIFECIPVVMIAEFPA